MDSLDGGLLLCDHNRCCIYKLFPTSSGEFRLELFCGQIIKDLKDRPKQLVDGELLKATILQPLGIVEDPLDHSVYICDQFKQIRVIKRNVSTIHPSVADIHSATSTTSTILNIASTLS